ncbi:target of rapamycin complex 2 subunit MAPKAP1 [Parasteatoda tepidariorum]|uniref:target of rapamycin complex 2 subunit MAPKAP1 n=1 Tax=Parasteatoda tepidariorum TaxID=114398 RepID=UPI001C71F2CF|nr:target of rapamycin complex 2 subunit MAPKAP1 [Parasteatoda tepidariorum]XP_042894966.1 target of rapamycin complex 2 subunit MAPKAP1 [Parasteatoda tepidariorum]
MAFYDDRKFLMSHIHHSFITCDDTGMCEMAMLNEIVFDKALRSIEDDKPELKVLNFYPESDLLEPSQSYDIVSGMGFIGGHRHRSNTAQRLEKMKKDRQIQAKITHVQWKNPPTQLTDKELSELFPEKDLSEVKKNKPPVKSALSEALELYPAAPNNPFGEYARFDGRLNRSAASKKILIYLTMLPAAERNYGTEVICLSNARVHELIGLICWMYTNEGKEPPLKSSVSSYCLKIAEETGEVDEDFPSLDNNEYVGKFGFPYLALIEHESRDPPPQVIMYIEGETFKFDVPKTDITLRDIAELASRRLSVRRSSAYHVEKLDEPGVPIPLHTKIANYQTLVFELKFEETTRERLHRESETDEYDAHMKAVEAPLYRSFNVTFCQKMGMNYDVQLGISGEKVEINPLPQKGAAKLLTRQQKPTTLYMDTIATCEIISKRYNPGKCTFKLVHLNQTAGNEFKKFVFETDPPTAQDIVKKVQLILEMGTTNACKEYQIYREKKLLKKFQKSQQTFKS